VESGLVYDQNLCFGGSHDEGWENVGMVCVFRLSSWKGAWLLILGQTNGFDQAKVATRRDVLFGYWRFVLPMYVSGRAADVVALLVASMMIDGVG
jgi:hypothetical protein